MLRMLLLALGLPVIALADVHPYPEEALTRVQTRSIPDIERVFRDDILQRLPREIRPRGSQITLIYPKSGRNALDFYADPTTQSIALPLSSLRFFDDMATLYAWIARHNCRLEYAQTYLLMAFDPDEMVETPLIAFGIDRDVALADSYVNDVSGKVFSSGVQFLLAHELGHLLLDHQGGLIGGLSQQQEREADAFALEHFARLGGLPGGAFWYYQMTMWNDPLADAERSRSTHPISGDRMVALGDRLLATPMDFAHGELDPQAELETVEALGQMFLDFATQLEDDALMTFMHDTQPLAFPPTDFMKACPG